MSCIIIDNVPQNTPEWDLLRLGIPTASMMSCIITANGKASTQAATYMSQLIIDWHAGKPVDHWDGNKFTEIGHEREEESEAAYTLLTDNVVDPVSFVYKDDRKLVGCSPDGLIGTDGLFEQKNPKGSTMVNYIIDKKIPTTYVPQVQAQLWICERDWCDFLISHPEAGQIIIRAARDEKYITTISGLVAKFVEQMLEKRAKFKEALAS